MSFIIKIGNFYVHSCTSNFGVTTTSEIGHAKQYPTREQALLDVESLVNNLWFRHDAFEVIKRTIDVKLTLEEAEYILRYLDGINPLTKTIFTKIAEARKS